MSTTMNSPAPLPDPVADVETGNAADSLKDTEKHEVEEKRKLVFVDEWMVKGANFAANVALVIIVFYLLFNWVYVVMTDGSWSDTLMDSLVTVIMGLFVVYCVIPLYRRLLLCDEKVTRPSSSTPAASDLDTSLLSSSEN